MQPVDAAAFLWRRATVPFMIEAELPGARVLFTGRAGGISEGPYASLNLGPWTGDDPAHVTANLERLAQRSGVIPVFRRQVHGTVVDRVTSTPGPEPWLDGCADGQATASGGIGPLVLTADCLPVALAGDGAVAMLHAGWRGLVDGVLEEGVRAMRELGGAGPIAALIGPGAGGCCYEVGDEVSARFAPYARHGRLLDLKVAAMRRLRAAGVARVEDVGRCTMCEPTVFFSHRRSGPVTGRQAGTVWIS
jgi:YfiH family protein